MRLAVILALFYEHACYAVFLITRMLCFFLV